MVVLKAGLLMASLGLLAFGAGQSAPDNRNASSAQAQVTPAPGTDQNQSGSSDPNEKLKKQQSKTSKTSGHETGQAEQKKKAHSNGGKKSTPAPVATPSSKS